jgi:hypothetical protein
MNVMNGAAAKRDLHQIIDELSEGELTLVRRLLTEALPRPPAEPSSSDPNAAGNSSDDGTPPIWEQIVELGQSVPEDAWREVPSDLAVNHDHYLHGAPKAEP